MNGRPQLRGLGIGAGYFAQFHHEAWTRIPEVRIVGICDLDQARSGVLARRFGVQATYQDWRSALDIVRPDFIDIATPPSTHAEICSFAAERGIHIICQKPLAPDFETSREIVEMANRSRVRFMVHENWRWQPWYRAIAGLRDAGAIGEFLHMNMLTRLGDGWGEEPYSSRQPYFRSYPRLLVFETGVHFIDVARFLFGEVSAVYANMRRINCAIRGEDAATIYLKFSSGATFLWDANRYNESDAADPRLTFGELRLDATKGHLTMDADANICVKLLGEDAFPYPYDLQRINFAGDCVYFTQRHFVDRLISGLPFETNGDDYLRTLSVVEAVYRSADTDEVATVQPPRGGQ